MTFNYLKWDYGGKPQPIYVKGRVGVNTMEDWDRVGTRWVLLTIIGNEWWQDNKIVTSIITFWRDPLLFIINTNDMW